jgi:Flp pilus assembly pilin Flp
VRGKKIESLKALLINNKKIINLWRVIVMLLNTYVRLRTMMVCRKGQGLVEYLILITLLAVALIAPMILFRDAIIEKLNEIKDSILKAN